jgi:hypothetical protein
MLTISWSEVFASLVRLRFTRRSWIRLRWQSGDPAIATRLLICCIAIAYLFSARNSYAQVVVVPPFVGSHSETWEEFGVNNIPSGTSILGGIATISGKNMRTKKQFQMCSVFGRPSDGIILMAQDRPNDLVTISFSQPVSAFGAYWGSGYLCPPFGYDDAATILTFQDINGNVIGRDSFFYQGDGTLMWRGYTFGTPIKTITRTADDGQEGVAMDGLQATVSNGLPTPTPTPTATPTITPTPTVTPTPSQTVMRPVISPAGGIFKKKVTLKISCATAGATIYYTLDGTDPTSASAIYSTSKKFKGIKLKAKGLQTVKAMAAASGFNNSTVTSAIFTIN